MRITITAESTAAEPLVSTALAAMHPSSTTEVEGAHLTVAGQENAWRLTDHTKEETRTPRTKGDLVYCLTDRIIHHVAAAATNHHCLHAAAVSYQGRALIMPAGSGSGKSSLTAWLVANGFDYITDELVLIDEKYGIDGIARPIQIKARGMPAVSHLFDTGECVLPGDWSNSVPTALLGGHASSLSRHTVGLVVFPEYKQGVGYSMSPLTAADAGMKFIPNHINARNLRGHGFRSLMGLVRSSPCFTLKYGGFNDLPGDFVGRLRNLL